MKKKKVDKMLMILGYLSRYGSITRHTALTHFEVWDLHRIIFRLKKEGHEIQTLGKGDALKYTMAIVADKYKIKPSHSTKVTHAIS